VRKYVTKTNCGYHKGVRVVTVTVTDKHTYSNWGWWTVPSVADINRHLKQLHTFFMTVRVWPH